MSEIARLASLINHVGCDQWDAIGQCGLCDDLRGVLAGLLKRQEVREAEQNPAIEILTRDQKAQHEAVRSIVGTLTDQLKKQHDRIIQLEEHDFAIRTSHKVSILRIVELEDLVHDMVFALENPTDTACSVDAPRLARDLLKPLKEFLI